MEGVVAIIPDVALKKVLLLHVMAVPFCCFRLAGSFVTTNVDVTVGVLLVSLGIVVLNRVLVTVLVGGVTQTTMIRCPDFVMVTEAGTVLQAA